jgi:septum formation protein
MEQNNTQLTPLILASASPRRHELLTSLAIAFTVAVSDAEESDLLPDTTMMSLLPPVAVPLHDHPTVRAWRKGYQIAMLRRDAAILAADTIVVINGQVLNKPVDASDAYRMLRLLSGQTHQVYTGMTLFIAGRRPLFHVCCSDVTMQLLTDQQITEYVATGESLDKAGAYGIQGMAGTLVTAVTGSYTNVVGLPLRDTISLLAHVPIMPGRDALAAYDYWRRTLHYSSVPHGSDI